MNDELHTTLVHRAVRDIQAPAVANGQTPGHRVRLLVEPGRWVQHDPFLLLAEDWFAPGTFGDHPHRGFETVTLVLGGELEHRDSHGGHGILQPGDAQWLTAGRGVVHAEEPRTPQAHTLQLWLNLPASRKMIAPAYQDLKCDELPVRRGEGFEARVYSGSSGDTRAPTRNIVPVTMLSIALEPGASFLQDLPGRSNAFLYVVSGRGRFGVEGTPARAGQVVWFTNSDEWAPSEVTMVADDKLRVVFYAAEPLGEPVVARGPFVMNSAVEIEQAYTDYRNGRF